MHELAALDEPYELVVAVVVFASSGSSVMMASVFAAVDHLDHFAAVTELINWIHHSVN